jgi:hypothetical protein
MFRHRVNQCELLSENARPPTNQSRHCLINSEQNYIDVDPRIPAERDDLLRTTAYAWGGDNQYKRTPTHRLCNPLESLPCQKRIAAANVKDTDAQSRYLGNELV